MAAERFHTALAVAGKQRAGYRRMRLTELIRRLHPFAFACAVVAALKARHAQQNIQKKLQ